MGWRLRTAVRFLCRNGLNDQHLGAPNFHYTLEVHPAVHSWFFKKSYLSHAAHKKSGRVYKWDQTFDNAFGKLKRHLTKPPVMVQPDLSKSLSCHTDACQLAVGGTLAQLDKNKGEYDIISYLNSLSGTEGNYSRNDLELLGFNQFLQRIHLLLSWSE